MNEQNAERLGRLVADDIDAVQRADLSQQKAAFVRGLSRPPKRSSALWLTLVGGLAALVVAVLVLTRATPVTFSVAGNPGREGQAIVASASDVAMHFADGSDLNLAAGSDLRVATASRNTVVVSLAKGRLDAAVTHGTALRWRFDAHRYRVHIVGTKFSLVSDPQALVVDVTEGAIRIDVPGSSGESVRVVAGQHFVGRDGGYKVEATEDEAEPEETPAPLERHVTKTKAPPVPPSDDNWRRQLANGQYDGAIATVKRLGLTTVTANANIDELSKLANAARLARDAETAKRVFDSVRERFPKSREAKRVPFMLGRITMELDHDPRAAAKQFAAYIAGDPSGDLVEEAFGREMEAWRAAGEGDRAKQTAVRYLARFPEGDYAALAHSLGGP